MHADPVCQCLTGCAVYGGVAFLAGRQALASATRARQGTQSLQRTRYAILAGLQLCDACAIMPFTRCDRGHRCQAGLGTHAQMEWAKTLMCLCLLLHQQVAQCWPAPAGTCCICWPRCLLASPAPGVWHPPRCQQEFSFLLRAASPGSESLFHLLYQHASEVHPVPAGRGVPSPVHEHKWKIQATVPQNACRGCQTLDKPVRRGRGRASMSHPCLPCPAVVWEHALLPDLAQH